MNFSQRTRGIVRATAVAMALALPVLTNNYMKLHENKITRTLAGIACSGLLLAALTVRADETGDKGRAIFKQNQQAVVTVQLLVKSKVTMEGMSDRSNETKQEVTGTVVDPSGLTVLALSATDPGALIQSMFEGQDARVKMETEINDLNILLEDGTELPAEIVLRDKDLDLAFIRPKTKPAQPLKAVDMGQAGKAEILDQVVTLNRLGPAAARCCAEVGVAERQTRFARIRANTY